MTTPPLSRLRIVEFDGMGPIPLAAKLLADLGADVVRIARAGASDRAAAAELCVNRRVVRLDLKTAAGRDAALDIVACADGVLEGFRPGVMERLGLGPEACQLRNPALVYVRMTGWGQVGPLALRAGHDLNYIATTGILHAIGSADRPPSPPLNLIGDYGGGSTFAIIGLLSGIIQARVSGEGQVVDAAMVDGAAALSTAIHAMMNAGHWADRRESNMLDGAAPFYCCYTCADGKHVAVGALEPEFFALLLDGLGIARNRFVQRDRAVWSDMAAAFAAAFASKPRDAWMETFEGTDACVTPVLSLAEARAYPHNVARGIFEGRLPAAAPRFGGVAPAALPLMDGMDSTPDQVVERWSRPSDGILSGRGK